MRLLLDSHVLVWWAGGDTRLNPAIVEIIAGADQLVVSLATPWELEVKVVAGRLKPVPIDWTSIGEHGLELIPADLGDVLAAARLPMHHRDPFDRLIIAQAVNRGLTLVTADRAFERYSVPILRA